METYFEQFIGDLPESLEIAYNFDNELYEFLQDINDGSELHVWFDRRDEWIEAKYITASRWDGAWSLIQITDAGRRKLRELRQDYIKIWSNK